MITVSKATIYDLMLFIKNIRPMDAEEVKKTTGKSIAHHFTDLMSLPNVHVIKSRNGDLLGIGGWLGGEEIRGWMLLTTAVENHKIEFLRWSKKFVNDLLKDHKKIYNQVYRKNKLRIDYLTYLGAAFYIIDKDFYYFEIERR